MNEGNRKPLSTYRLQLHEHFRFSDALSLVSYLQTLGISDIYASPILKARKGSMHGYDVVDPLQLNPELGTEDEFESLTLDLKSRGMGFILDIVPNHMAASHENPWWFDILENGLASPFSSFFDIDWHHFPEVPDGKVLLPILGHPLTETLEQHEIAIEYDHGLLFRYYESILPLDIKSYELIIEPRCDPSEHHLATDTTNSGHFQTILTLLRTLPDQGVDDITRLEDSYQERQRIKKEFITLMTSSSSFQELIRRNMESYNKDSVAFKDDIKTLLERQAYVVEYWWTGMQHVNYRRFFNINELVGTKIENPFVFDMTHSLLRRLVLDSHITGLRVDHVDGSKDPSGYLQRLQRYINSDHSQQSTEGQFFVVVEKILAEEESLDNSWPVCGTTGYDFLNVVNRLFIHEEGFASLANTYKGLTGSTTTFGQVIYEKKKQVMSSLFCSEISSLASNLTRISQESAVQSPSEQTLMDVITEVTACLSVYRTYIRDFSVSDQDRYYLENALREAREKLNLEEGLSFLKKVLLLDFTDDMPHKQRAEWLAFVMRWQQFTGAIMAKGLEDTALYCFHPLISLNDVGSKPALSSLSLELFHKTNLTRQKYWPLTLNATSTHDTKRSEDVRARINVLSEIPKAWYARVSNWIEWNLGKKRIVSDVPVPDIETELMLYQTLLGAWPLEENDISSFQERLRNYMIKAAREAKLYTRWLTPDTEYEESLIGFVDSILDRSERNTFFYDFLEFQEYVAFYGALNSLSQVVLKTTSPGIPDFYQGTELWDFSLVDPDNRRSINYEVRNKNLEQLIAIEEEDSTVLLNELMTNWKDGRIKLFTTYKMLHFRDRYRDLFQKGIYIPLSTNESDMTTICAFARVQNSLWSLTIAPRFFSAMVDYNCFHLGEKTWGDTNLILPNGVPLQWKNVFTGEEIELLSNTNHLPLWRIFNTFPIAVLESMG